MSDLKQYIDKMLSTISIESHNPSVPLQEYDIHKEICELIVRTRNELGLTQKELATLSGITQANISKIENGSTHPSVATLKNLADSMGRRLFIDFIEQESVE